MNRIVHRYQNDSVFFFELLLWRTHPEWKCCLVCKERRLVVNYFLGFKLRRVSIASVDLCLLGNDVSCWRHYDRKTLLKSCGWKTGKRVSDATMGREALLNLYLPIFDLRVHELDDAQPRLFFLGHLSGSLRRRNNRFPWVCHLLRCDHRHKSFPSDTVKSFLTVINCIS
jgi:hypothetical protein